MGITMVVFSIGFAIGYDITNLFGKFTKISNFAVASISWSVITAIMIPITYKIKIAPLQNEDIEEEADHVLIPKKPLIASVLYGIVEVALFAIFFPTLGEGAAIDYANIPVHHLMNILCIGVLVGSYLLGYLSDRIGSVPILIFLTLIAIFSFGLLPFFRNHALQTKIIFFSLGFVTGGLCPLSFSWLLELTDDESLFGKASGAFSVYQGAGSIIGCIICGLIYYLFKTDGFFLFLALVFVAYFYLLATSPPRRISNIADDEKKFRGLLGLLEPVDYANLDQK